MPAKYEAILFDLDGTLLDSARNFYEILQELAAKWQLAPIELDLQSIRHLVPYGAQTIVHESFAAQKLPEPQISSMVVEFLKLYALQAKHRNHMIPGIPQLLTKLNNNNICWGIVTNKLKRYTEKVIANLPDLSKARVVVSGDTCSTCKPNPEPLNYAAMSLDVKPDSCLFVGDSQIDIAAAQNCGMPSVLANFGYIPAQSPIATWGANFIANEPNDIFEIIENHDS